MNRLYLPIICCVLVALIVITLMYLFSGGGDSSKENIPLGSNGVDPQTDPTVSHWTPREADYFDTLFDEKREIDAVSGAYDDQMTFRDVPQLLIRLNHAWDVTEKDRRERILRLCGRVSPITTIDFVRSNSLDNINKESIDFSDKLAFEDPLKHDLRNYDVLKQASLEAIGTAFDRIGAKHAVSDVIIVQALIVRFFNDFPAAYELATKLLAERFALTGKAEDLYLLLNTIPFEGGITNERLKALNKYVQSEVSAGQLPSSFASGYASAIEEIEKQKP